MIPKKASSFIPSTAEETGHTEDLVKAVTDYYWKELRKSLSTIEEPKIIAEGIGTFRMKHWKLKEKREKYNAILAKYEGKENLTFQQFAIVKAVKERLAKLDIVEEKVNKELERRTEIRQRRKDVIREKNMGEQGSDN